MQTTTKQRLIELMRKHKLSVQDVARMLNKSDATIYGWRTRVGVVPPAEMIELLELKLNEKNV